MHSDPAQARREQELVDTVVASYAGAPDERAREVLVSLTRHLHAFIRDIRLTPAEWQVAIDFLTATGHRSDAKRQEFVMLSDVLGASMQTITVNDTVTGSTDATVLGPFFVADAPRVELGGDIAFGAGGEPCWVEGTVTDTTGRPVPGATLEVWEADDDGLYDVQRPDAPAAARGRLEADGTGTFRFWALTPTPYPIPTDGPVGRLLAVANRSPMRAPHLHFLVEAPGYERLVTHVFVAGDDVGYDAVFGVRESLVRTFERHDASDATPDGRVVTSPTWARTRFDIVLAPSSAG